MLSQRYLSNEDLNTIRRTLLVWFGSNLGGTLWLLADFSRDRLSDYSIALLVGLVAALVSLAIIPLVVPFFVVMCHFCTGWMRRTMALTGIGLFYLLANALLILLFPIDSLLSLVKASFPYLAAALLMVVWLYGPGKQVGKPLGQLHPVS